MTTALGGAVRGAPPGRGPGRLLAWARRADPPVGPPAVPAWAGLLLALGALLPVAVGGLLFRRSAPSGGVVALQLAGSRASALAAVDGHGGDGPAALRADAWLTGGACLTLVAVALLGRYVFGRVRWRLTALAAGGAGLLAACCAFTADVLLARGLDDPGGSDAPFAVACGLATVVWLLLLPAGAVAVGVLA
ncbi:hypothetical protein AB0O00_12350, partial [Kitasatospora sp. NPDC093558]